METKDCMAKLVKFLTQDREDIYINPDDVSSVHQSSRNTGFCYVVMMDKKTIHHLACTAESAFKRLNEISGLGFNHKPQHDYKGMGVTMTVTVGCTDEDELLQHLSVLRSQLKRKLKKAAIPLDGGPNSFRLEDNNCYGVHEATVNYE